MKLLTKISIPAIAAALLIGRFAAHPASTLASENPQAPPLHVGMCLDEKTDYSDMVRAGFKDALTDHYGEGQVVFAEQTTAGAASPATAAETLIQANSELLFAYGNESLDAAASVTDTIPILFSGVVDYHNVLHLFPGANETTGRNIAGIAGKSAATAEVSLLIEATGNHPQAVGIFYDPTDTDAIKQNEIVETLLDEAGIPWKEYEVAAASDEEPSSDSTPPSPDAVAVPLPAISAAASGKEGANIHPDSIGDNGDLTGINEPMSARSPQQSVLWKKGKTKRMPSEFKDILELACKECDSLYFCADNRLTKREADMKTLSELCTKTGTVSVSSDPNAGRFTLVSLYQDPYDLGYQCGRMSISVLEEEEDITELAIGTCDPDKTVKLFEQDVSNAMKKSWPKSFKEREAFLENYTPGEMTEREE